MSSTTTTTYGFFRKAKKSFVKKEERKRTQQSSHANQTKINGVLGLWKGAMMKEALTTWYYQLKYETAMVSYSIREKKCKERIEKANKPVEEETSKIKNDKKKAPKKGKKQAVEEVEEPKGPLYTFDDILYTRNIITTILCYLATPTALHELQRVNKTFYGLCQQNDLWKIIYNNLTPIKHTEITINSPISYRMHVERFTMRCSRTYIDDLREVFNKFEKNGLVHHREAWKEACKSIGLDASMDKPKDAMKFDEFAKRIIHIRYQTRQAQVATFFKILNCETSLSIDQLKEVTKHLEDISEADLKAMINYADFTNSGDIDQQELTLALLE
mmetsp:Transcript_7434/g.10988  ORF Transcript_7434/g.10988 Transcript_7434/m.10988 type:complete len:330 (+) Transcript_7434:1044-2033(+)